MNYFDILPASNTRYNIRLTDIQKKGACVGFCTTKGFGNNYNFYSPESVYYACWETGSVYEGGKEKKIDVASSNGDLIECQADINRNRVYWWKNGVLIVECPLPEKMREKSVYLSIILLYANDSIDLFI
jgi:hypothetical protein